MLCQINEGVHYETGNINCKTTGCRQPVFYGSFGSDRWWILGVVPRERILIHYGCVRTADGTCFAEQHYYLGKDINEATHKLIA